MLLKLSKNKCEYCKNKIRNNLHLVISVFLSVNFLNEFIRSFQR